MPKIRKRIGIYLPVKDTLKPRDFVTNPGIIDAGAKKRSRLLIPREHYIL